MTEQKKPLLLIIAGPNCSGKTTEFYLARDIDATMSQEQYVNADEIARELLLKGEYSSKDINQLYEQEGNLVNYIAARKCAERRNKLMEQGADLATETVASTPRVLSIIDSGRQHGYMVSVNFVILRKDDLNVYRVADRVANGGHGVPEEKIRARYHRALAQMPEVLAKADKALLTDNSVMNNIVLRKQGNNVFLFPDGDAWPQDRLRDIFNKMQSFAPELVLAEDLDFVVPEQGTDFTRHANEGFARWLDRLTDNPEFMKQACEYAIKSHFAQGRPVHQADSEGIYELWPDGRKVYI